MKEKKLDGSSDKTAESDEYYFNGDSQTSDDSFQDSGSYDDSYDSSQASSYSEPVRLKVAEFGFNYSKVFADVSHLQTKTRDTNWATLESLVLTVRNDESSTIINPTKIKIKLNNKGKGSVWWDDEVWLPDSFKNLRPGQEVTEVIPVHVSYSDIYQEKDFRLVVLDDYDVPMVYVKKIITLN